MLLNAFVIEKCDINTTIWPLYTLTLYSEHHYITPHFGANINPQLKILTLIVNTTCGPLQPTIIILWANGLT